MGPINGNRLAFWAVLWWFVYTAPTEDPFVRFKEDVIERVAAFPATTDWVGYRSTAWRASEGHP
jgi:hypothetical protein